MENRGRFYLKLVLHRANVVEVIKHLVVGMIFPVCFLHDAMHVREQVMHGNVGIVQASLQQGVHAQMRIKCTGRRSRHRPAPR